MIPSLEWTNDNKVKMIDQTILEEINNIKEMCDSQLELEAQL